MRRMSAIVMTMSFCLLFVGVHAAEKDAGGCKDHPLVPRPSGYYIAGCNETPAMADLDVIRGEIAEPVHFEGKSIALSYMPQPGLKAKPSEAQLRAHFEEVAKKWDGSLYGRTYGQEWPVYTISKDGKNFWVILMVSSGEYYTGSFACRIIDKD